MASKLQASGALALTAALSSAGTTVVMQVRDPEVRMHEAAMEIQARRKPTDETEELWASVWAAQGRDPERARLLMERYLRLAPNGPHAEEAAWMLLQVQKP